jgi:HK97 family phage major capsid protein
MPYDQQMTDAERNLQTLALNSNAQIKLLTAMRAAQVAASTKPPSSIFAGPNDAATAGAQFLSALRATKLRQATPAQHQLLNSVSTWAGEQVGADGGFALPAAWAPRIERVVFADSVLGALRPRPVASDIFRVPTSSTPPWAGTGIQAPRVAEGAQVSPTKAPIGMASVPLYRRSVLAPFSEEIVHFASEAVFAFTEEELLARVREAAEAWVVAGTGANEPVGILSAPGRIEVAGEAGQTAGAIVAANVAKMAARVTRIADAFWVSHPRALEQIATLPAPMYLGAGGPAGSLLGRPLYTSEHMQDLGSAGDLALIDPAGVVFPVDGPRLADTFEFLFDQDLHAFRATFELGCAPKLSAPVARKNGSGTASHIVTLGARS